jgi:uncharacterized protein YdeI (YjbR/CyaY-like superfamily)
MPVKTPAIPHDLKEALKDIEGAVAAIDQMPLEYQRWAFLFIEQATNAPTRGYRISNFVEVVRFFQQDSAQMN